MVGNLDYASYGTIAFQRGSVIASEALLLAATWYATRCGSSRSPQRGFVSQCSSSWLRIDSCSLFLAR